MFGRRMLVWIVLATACATSKPERRPGDSGGGRPSSAPALVLVDTWAAGGGTTEDRWSIVEPHEAVMAPDGRWVVVIGASETVVFSVPSGARLGALLPGARISGIAASPDSRRFAVGDLARHCVAVWSIDPLREETCLRSDPALAEPGIAFSPDGTELAITDQGWLARWSLRANAPIWRMKLVALSKPFSKWIVWPTAGTIVVDGDHGEFQGYDAGTPRLRWQQQGAACYLGSVAGDAILAGVFHDGKVPGLLARLELTSGRLREVTGGDSTDMYCGAMLDDETVVLVDVASVAHRYSIAGAELASFALPGSRGLPGIAGRRNGRIAAVFASNYIALWDLSAGAPLQVPGVQQGRILALDADPRVVVSAAADGTVAVRSPDGRVLAQHRTRGTGCVAWAVDAPSRRAVCAVDLEAVAVPPSHEWFDLDSGRARVADWNRSHVVAIDGRGTTWSVVQEYASNNAAWIETAAQGSDEIQVPEPSQVDIGLAPSIARIVDRGRAVAFGGGAEDGLWLMDRRGALTRISGDRVLDLAADRAGDRLGIATLSGIELWHRTGSSAWTRRWSYRDAARASGRTPHARPMGVVALSHDGRLLAATEGESARTIAVYDADTGARIAALEVGDPDRFVTALAIGSAGAIYAGTNTGRVLALSLRR